MERILGIPLSFLGTLVFTSGGSQESSALLQAKTWPGQFCEIHGCGAKRELQQSWESASELRAQLVAASPWTGLWRSGTGSISQMCVEYRRPALYRCILPFFFFPFVLSPLGDKLSFQISFSPFCYP